MSSEFNCEEHAAKLLKREISNEKGDSAHAILGLDLDKNASEKDVRDHYTDLARRLHPDKNNGSLPAHTAFKELGSAYNLLKGGGPQKEEKVKEKPPQEKFRQKPFPGTNIELAQNIVKNRELELRLLNLEDKKLKTLDEFYSKTETDPNGNSKLHGYALYAASNLTMSYRHIEKRMVDIKGAINSFYNYLFEKVLNKNTPLDLINKQNKEGNTALHLLINNHTWSGLSEMIEGLLMFGADPCIENKAGLTALGIAETKLASLGLDIRMGPSISIVKKLFLAKIKSGSLSEEDSKQKLDLLLPIINKYSAHLNRAPSFSFISRDSSLLQKKKDAISSILLRFKQKPNEKYKDMLKQIICHLFSARNLLVEKRNVDSSLKSHGEFFFEEFKNTLSDSSKPVCSPCPR